MNVLWDESPLWQWDSLGDVELTAPPLQKPCLQIWNLFVACLTPYPLHRLPTTSDSNPQPAQSRLEAKTSPISILHVRFLIPVITHCFTPEQPLKLAPSKVYFARCESSGPWLYQHHRAGETDGGCRRRRLSNNSIWETSGKFALQWLS